MFNTYENSFGGSEDELVKLFMEKYRNKVFWFGHNHYSPEYHEQIRIKEVSRISDLVIKFGDKRLVNIEFKLNAHGGVYGQAKDHAKWADYSYICIPVNTIQHADRSFLSNLHRERIGLVLGTKDSFFDMIPAGYKTDKEGKDRKIRQNVLNTIALRNQKQEKLL